MIKMSDHHYFYAKFFSQYQWNGVFKLTDDIWIITGSKEEVNLSSGVTIYLNSCYFVLKTNKKTERNKFLERFKEFLAVYSFVLNDSHPIYCAESGDFFEIKEYRTSSVKMLQKFILKQNPGNAKADSRILIDFCDLGKESPFFSFLKSISLAKLYNDFLDLNTESKNLFYLYIFNPEKINSNIQIYRPAFLKIALKYVIIEKLLCDEKQNFCTEEIEDCLLCKRKKIKHHDISLTQLVKIELEKVIEDATVRSEYAKYIEMAKDIRNKCFHIGSMDDAIFQVGNVPLGGTLIFDFEKTKKYKQDQGALMNLDIQISDIVRYLLFSKFLHVNYFPKLKMLRQMRISSK